MRLFVHLVLAVTALVAVPEVEAQTVPEPAANSGPAKSVARDIYTLAGGLKSQCVADDPPKWAKWIASFEEKIGNFSDATDKAAWMKYVGSLRAVYEARLVGEPGLGSFAEMNAKHKALSGDLTTMKPTDTVLPADPAEAKKIGEKIVAYKAKLDETLAFAKRVYDGTRCQAKHTGDWYALKKRAEGEQLSVNRTIATLVDQDAGDLNRWASNLPQGTQEPAKDWSKHTHYAGNVLEQLGKAQKFQARVDALLVLAPMRSGGGDADLVPENAAVLKAYLAKNEPLAKKLIGEMMVPKAPGSAKQLADLKKLMATYKTGKQVGTSSARKPSTETYSEWDGGRKYTVVKKKYSGFYVWVPNTPSENTPTIEGLKPTEICELWATNLVNYEKGGPSHSPLKTWRGSESVFMGFMLCSNKSKKSPLPYK